jgi:hypothetical protein
MPALAAVAVVVLLFELFVHVVRRMVGPREDYSWRHAFEESPITLIDRVEAAAGRIRGYSSHRDESQRSIVLFRDGGPFAAGGSTAARGSTSAADPSPA